MRAFIAVVLLLLAGCTGPGPASVSPLAVDERAAGANDDVEADSSEEGSGGEGAWQAVLVGPRSYERPFAHSLVSPVVGCLPPHCTALVATQQGLPDIYVSANETEMFTGFSFFVSAREYAPIHAPVVFTAYCARGPGGATPFVPCPDRPQALARVELGPHERQSEWVAQDLGIGPLDWLHLHVEVLDTGHGAFVGSYQSYGVRGVLYSTA